MNDNDGPAPPEEAGTSGAAPPTRTRAAPGGARRRPPDAGAEGGWRNSFKSLSNRHFLFLWLGQLAIMAGMQMQMLARGYLVYDLTDSATILGIVNAGSSVPMLSLVLFGGVIADRVDRKRIIQAGQVGALLIALGVGISITTGTVTWYHLLTASVLQGVLFALMGPARQAIIPQMVGRDLLTNAMALNAAAMSMTTLVAPAFAGNAYALLGPDRVYYIITGLGVLAVVFTTFIPGGRSTSGRGAGTALEQIRAGFEYILSSPLVRTLLFMGLATTLLAIPFRFLLPVFVVDIYQRGPEAMGLLTAVMGGGSLIGSLYIASLGKRNRGLILIGASFASGIALALVSAIPYYAWAVGFMVLLGLGDAGRRALNQSLIMEVSEDQYRGRVMSVFMMNFGLMPLAVLPVGVIVDWQGGQVAIGILAVMLIATVTFVLVFSPRLRRLQ